MEKQNFYDLNFDQLKSFLIEKGEVEPKKAKMRSQQLFNACLLYTSPNPRDKRQSRMPSSA